MAHLAREWLLGRFNGFRRFSWLTGVPLLPLAFVCAIGGFWLNWDRLGQYSAVATAEWLDALPFLASPLARNFLGGAVSDRLFSFFVFVHLGVPLLLVFGLWFHIQRIARAEVFPPRALGIGTAAALLAMALALPVRSQGPADLGSVPGPLALDWWLLFIHPLTAATSPGFVWALVLASIAGLFALPFLRPRVAPTVAKVDPAQLQRLPPLRGQCPCRRIAIVPHPNGRRGVQLARWTRTFATAACCVGACPRRRRFEAPERLETGIDMPQSPIDALRRRLEGQLAAAAALPASSSSLRSRCAHRHARVARHLDVQPGLHGDAAAVVRGVCVALRSGWGRRCHLSGGRVRVPPGRALDGAAPGRRARAAPAPGGAGGSLGPRRGGRGRRVCRARCTRATAPSRPHRFPAPRQEAIA